MKNDLRILMTTDTVGGVWTYSLDLARVLTSRGMRVTLAAMGGQPSAAQLAQANSIAGVDLRASDFRLEWMADPWVDVREAGDWLLSLEAELQPDIIHLNNYAHGTLPFAAPIIMAGHSCVVSWWLAVKGEDAPLPEWRRYRDVVAAGLRAANVVVAPTQAMLSALDRHYGPLPPSRVIHNGRDASNYRAPTKEPLVLAAGRLWDEAKNIGTLARAANDLTWPVWVAGNNRSPDGTTQSFRNVNLLGTLDERTLATWYGRASIYAMPARYEPFGLSALEAALSGCALVLGDIPSLREVWQDAAIYTPPSDADALRAAIADLVDKPRKQEIYAARARSRATTFTTERMADDYLTIYRSLHRPKRSAPRPIAAGTGKEVACAS